MKKLAMVFMVGAFGFLTGCGASMTTKDYPYKDMVSVSNYDRIKVSSEVNVKVKLDDSITKGVYLLDKKVIEEGFKDEMQSKGIAVKDGAKEKFTLVAHLFMPASSQPQDSQSSQFGAMTGNAITGVAAGALFNAIRGPSEPWKVGFKILDENNKMITSFVHHKAYGALSTESAAKEASKGIPVTAAEFFELKK